MRDPPPKPAVKSAALGPTPTASRPSSTATALASWPTMNFVGVSVRGSILVTVPAAPVVAQSAPSP